MRVLRRGDQGAGVQELQEELARAGWPIAVDGDFGLRTDAAVRALQRESDVDADGVVGDNTRKALARAPSTTRPDPVAVRIDVPYATQRDNRYRPSGTCNVTSMAMVLRYRGVAPRPGHQLEDDLFELLHGKEGRAEMSARHSWAIGKVNPWNVHGLLDWAADRHGVPFTYTTAATWSRIDGALHGGEPVIVSGTFTGQGGHIVVLVGRTSAGDYLVHDPWGDWNRGYRERDGAYRIYRAESLREVLRASPTEKWAHFLA